MAKKDLIPNSMRTPEELHEMTVKGGIKSGEARRKKKKLKELANMLLDNEVSDDSLKQKLEENGLDTSNKSLTILKLFQIALNGKFGDSTKLKGIEMLMKYAGEDLPEEMPNVNPVINVKVIDNSKLEKEMYNNEIQDK